jgi:hypothetical protein
MRTIAILLLAVAVAACGGESVSENLAEQAIERAGGGDVDIDIDEGDDGFQASVETEDGSMTVGGGEIPEALEIPVPSGGDVMTTLSDSTMANVQLSWPRSEYESLVAFYEDWVADQSEEFSKSTSSYESGGQTMRTTSWTGDGGRTSIIVADCFSLQGDDDVSCVTLTQQG